MKKIRDEDVHWDDEERVLTKIQGSSNLTSN